MSKDKIKNILYQLGVNSTYLGYYYLVMAITMTLETEENLAFICKNIYPRIAEEYRTSISCVERNIRTVGEIMFEHGDKKLLAEIFPDISERPKNAQLIAYLSAYIKNKYSE